jgi:hypothetical protein
MTPSTSRVVRGPKVRYLREDADHGGGGGGRRRDARLGRLAFFPLTLVLLVYSFGDVGWYSVGSENDAHGPLCGFVGWAEVELRSPSAYFGAKGLKRIE